MSGRESGQACFSPVLENFERSVNEKNQIFAAGRTGEREEGRHEPRRALFLEESLGWSRGRAAVCVPPVHRDSFQHVHRPD